MRTYCHKSNTIRHINQKTPNIQRVSINDMRVNSEICNQYLIQCNLRRTMQLCRLSEVARKLINTSNPELRRRAKRAYILCKRHGKVNRRNKLAATVRDKHSKLKITFIMQSAGMGGKHPLHKGKSASHTEPIWAAIWKHCQGYIKQVFVKHLGYRCLKSNLSDLEVISIISTNSPCTSSPRDKSHGCSGIENSELGGAPHFDYLLEYQKDKKTETQAIKDLEIDEEKSSMSEDEYIDTELARGIEIKNAFVP